MLSGRPTKISLVGGALTVSLIAVVLLFVRPFGAVGRGKSCSSFPTPGAAAPTGTKVPAALAARYALFRAPQRSSDRISARNLSSLKASGLIVSAIRFVGDAGFGRRIYLIPAEHLLSLPLAPSRCLSRLQRLDEQDALSVALTEYRQPALCVVLLSDSGEYQQCVAAGRVPLALLFANGAPGFGLVPNGVSAVTVSYWAAPPVTVAVHRNFFVIVAPREKAPPCGVQWLDSTGNVVKIAAGCSYLLTERSELGEYRAYVASKLQTVRSQLKALSAAIHAGNLAAAKSAWLTAHLTWLEIGQDDGAYSAFGQLGGEIDGLAAGHKLGTADPGFTGFHRIEFELWTNRRLAAAGAETATLRHLLAELMSSPLGSYLPVTTSGIGNWLLRPHEVLEDALRDSLTADDDYGSGTDLASITADVVAVRVLLRELAPQVNLIAPHLIPTATAELNALRSAINATRVAGPGWVPLQNLSIRSRQHIDADVDAALETLAPFPDLITSTGSNAPAT